MTVADYEAYLSHFNARDYDRVLNHFNKDCDVVFAGYCFKGYQAIRDFYAFFHEYVNETISITRFVAGEETIALEAVVRLEAKMDLSSSTLAAKGLENLFALEKGQVIEVPQFIHYHLRDGKFSKALCCVFDPPKVVVTSLPQ